MATLWEGRSAQSEDDVFRAYNTSQFSLITSSLYCGHSDSAKGCAMRYPNVLVPAGKVIDAAVLYMRCRTSKTGTMNSRIRAQKAANPITFSDITDFDARVWTDEYINWDEIEAWSAPLYYTSDDFKAVVQEVINLPGWASGNAMVILWDDWEGRSSLNAERHPYSWDGGALSATKLIVTYSDPPPAGGEGGPANLVAAGII